MAQYEWVVLFRIDKSHRLTLPSFGRVLQWIAATGAKCNSIFICKRRKGEGNG